MERQDHPRVGVRLALLAGLVLGVTGCCSVSSTGGCLRSRTIRAKAALGDIESLRAWLADARSWVREEAALHAGKSRALALQPDVQSKLLDEDERPWVRAAAATALGDLGADPSTLASVALAPSTPSSVKIALVDAICRVAPDQGPSLIAGLLDDTDALVAAAAARRSETRCGR